MHRDGRSDRQVAAQHHTVPLAHPAMAVEPEAEITAPGCECPVSFQVDHLTRARQRHERVAVRIEGDPAPRLWQVAGAGDK